MGGWKSAGFAGGIAVGFVAAVGGRLSPPAGWNEAQIFLAVAGLSLVGSITATLAAAPVPADTLRRFYDRVAPFGWWPRAWREAHRREHRADLFRLAAALAWQVLTFLLPMAMVLGRWGTVALLALPWTVLLLFLVAEIRRAAPGASGRESQPPLPAFSP